MRRNTKILNSLIVLIFVSYISLYSSNSKTSSNDPHLTNQLKSKRSLLHNLFKLIYACNATLVDVHSLKDIQTNNHLTKLVKYLKNSESFSISFAISNNQISNLINCLKYKLNSKKCRLIQLNNLYINCYSNNDVFQIQILIMFKRGNFYWIDKDVRVTRFKKIFGDTPRALNIFNTSKFVDDFDNFFNIPSNLDSFQYDYLNSKFIECNHELAGRNLTILGVKYEQNREKNKLYAKILKYVTDVIQNMNKHYWLAGGTLLGWYRDCGVISHTKDIDIALWAHEYDDRIKKTFMGNKQMRVWLIHGLVNDSYEIRLTDNYLGLIDLFLVYKNDSTKQTSSYQIARKKYKRILPQFNELCSAELLSQKHLVPCDPVKYLNQEYGIMNWLYPNAVNFTWSNLIYSGIWSESEWINVLKYYYPNGSLNSDLTLNKINSALDFNKINTLPYDN